jgi:hypothetical protein
MQSMTVLRGIRISKRGPIGVIENLAGQKPLHGISPSPSSPWKARGPTGRSRNPDPPSPHPRSASERLAPADPRSPGRDRSRTGALRRGSGWISLTFDADEGLQSDRWRPPFTSGELPGKTAEEAQNQQDEREFNWRVRLHAGARSTSWEVYRIVKKEDCILREPETIRRDRECEKVAPLLGDPTEQFLNNLVPNTMKNHQTAQP